MTRFFGPNGEGGLAYERFVASIGRGGSDAGCSMGLGCDEYGVCYADAHGRPEMCPRDSDGSPKGGDGLPGSVRDANDDVCYELEGLGITGQDGWSDKLTPLGEQVRDHLKQGGRP